MGRKKKPSKEEAQHVKLAEYQKALSDLQAYKIRLEMYLLIQAPMAKAQNVKKVQGFQEERAQLLQSKNPENRIGAQICLLEIRKLMLKNRKITQDEEEVRRKHLREVNKVIRELEEQIELIVNYLKDKTPDSTT